MNSRDLLELVRPGQWSKNGILFAGLIFSRHLLDPSFALRSLGGFLVFCVASSAIYVLNDLCDHERDRMHPVKRSRPLPSGRVSRNRAGVITLVLLGVAAVASIPLGLPFMTCLAAFLLVNALYSVRLRSVVLLDVMLIAISFVIRAVAGVMVLRPMEADLELSPWLLVCTLFLALFLALGKRRHELGLLEGHAAEHRASLGEYSLGFLDQMISIVSAATLIAYAIYTIAPATVSKVHSPGLVVTIPFVAFGIFRYLFLIQARNEGGNPSRVLTRDLPLGVTLLGWLAVVGVVLYASRG